MGEKQFIMFNRQKALEKSQENFSNSNSSIVKIGLELEFFLLQKNLKPAENQAVTSFIIDLKKELLKNFPLVYELEKEQGASQIEVKINFTADLKKLAEEFEKIKNCIKLFAQKLDFIASFASQPFIDDCGNALQFNISLHEESTELTKNIIAGLLIKTNEAMLILAPKPEDYSRFSYEINKNLFKKGKYTAPVNLSYGANNRTCAIRLLKNRLEYRIAAADADIFLSLAAILNMMNYGIQNKLNPDQLGFKQLYGNAFDEQYELKSFCKNFEEAQTKFVPIPN